jgi:hypothetical protein
MARSLLSLYLVDLDAMRAIEAELRALLEEDDHAGVAKLLGLGAELAARVAARPAVEWFLRADDDPEAAPFHASLRRVTKKRALQQVWTSEHPSLEGRLRAYDRIRDETLVAEAIDRALDMSRVPFFLWRRGATMGLLQAADRRTLVDAIGPGGSLRDEGAEPLPDELSLFGDALADHEGTLLLHDAL